ncbi:Bap-like [Trichomonas vaginalis G3]|uniref:Bap-like n=1 Tax=Trichomonas vaginalis (strain ATCC PRA-98 / G3) TaxID=412133 RepID=A2DPH5_TRIV3|nr:putative b-glycosidase, glycoside hydrolase family 8 protein family [Trichomonas vaginalis G3]EAY17719.1 Bap-like [Trichomonas vaginalis G3]KAI5507877.1 putative b-glycosidase, glycoside hydrolase family 8 protein family [Trichomonas vaginalis G3]|eukprot:XP_001329854.1 Bap-like [Trichomonas vaginalis G3]
MILSFLPLIPIFSLQVQFNNYAYCPNRPSMNDGMCSIEYIENVYHSPTAYFSINGSADIQSSSTILYNGIIVFSSPKLEPGRKYQLTVKLFVDGAEVYTNPNLTLLVLTDMVASNLTVSNPIIATDGSLYTTHLVYTQIMYFDFDFTFYVLFDPDFVEMSIKDYDEEMNPISYYTYDDPEFINRLKYHGYTAFKLNFYSNGNNIYTFELRTYMFNRLSPGVHKISLWSTDRYSFSNMLNATIEIRQTPFILILNYPKLVKVGDPISLYCRSRNFEYDLEYYIYVNDLRIPKVFTKPSSNRKLLDDITDSHFNITFPAPSTPGNHTFIIKQSYKDAINSTVRTSSQATIAVRSPPVVDSVSTPTNVESQATSMRLSVSYTDLDAIDQLSLLYKFDSSSDYFMYGENLTITSQTGVLEVDIDLPTDRTLGSHKIFVKLIDSYNYESNTDKYFEFFIRSKPVVTFISLDKEFYVPGDNFISQIKIEDIDSEDVERIEYKYDSEYVFLVDNVIPSENIVLPSIPISNTINTSSVTCFIRVTDKYGFSNEIQIDLTIHFKPKLSIEQIPEKVVPGKKFSVVFSVDDFDTDDVFKIYYKSSTDYNLVTEYTDQSTILVSVPEDSKPGDLTVYFYCVDKYNLSSEEINKTLIVKGKPSVSITGPETKNVIPGNTITLKITVTDPDEDKVKVFVNGTDTKIFNENEFDVIITIPEIHGIYNISSNAIDEDGLVSDTSIYSFDVRDPPKIVSCKLDKKAYVVGDEFVPSCTFNDLDTDDYLRVYDNTTGDFEPIFVYVSMMQQTIEQQIKTYKIPEDFEGDEFAVYIKCTDKYDFESNTMKISVYLKNHPQINNVRINKESYIRGDHIIIDGEASDEDENDVITVNLSVNNDVYSQIILANSSEKTFHFDVLVKDEYEIGFIDISLNSIDLYGLKSIPEINLSKPLYFVPIIKSLETVDQIYVSPSKTIKIKVSIEDLDINDSITVCYKREIDPEFNDLAVIKTREEIFDIMIPEGTSSGPYNIEFKLFDSHDLMSNTKNIIVQVRIPPKITNVSSSKLIYTKGETIVVNGNIEDPDQNDEFNITIKIGELNNTKTIQSIGQNTPFSISLDDVPLGDYKAEIFVTDQSMFTSEPAPVDVKVRDAPKLTNITPKFEYFAKGDKIIVSGKIEDEDQNDEFNVTMRILNYNNTITVKSQGEITSFNISLLNVPLGDYTAEIFAIDKSMFSSSKELVPIKVRFHPILKNLTTPKPFFAKGESFVINGIIQDEDLDDEFTVTIRSQSFEKVQKINSNGLITSFSFEIDQCPVGDSSTTVYVADKYGFLTKYPLTVKVRIAPVIADLSFEEKRYKKGEQLTLHFTFSDEDINDLVTFSGDIGSSPFNDETHYDTSTTQKEGTITFTIPEDCEQGLVDINLKATDSNLLVSNILTKKIYILSSPTVKYLGKNLPKNAKPLDNVTVFFSVSNPDSDETVKVYIQVNNSEQILLGSINSPVENYMFNYTIFIPLDHPNYTIPYNFTAIDSTDLIGRNQTEIIVASHPPIVRYIEEFMPYMLNSSVPVRFALMDEDNDDTLSVNFHLFRKNYSLLYNLLENQICNSLTNHTVHIQLPADIEDNEYTVVITATDRAGLQSSDVTKLLVNTKAQFGQEGQVYKFEFEIVVDTRWYYVVLVASAVILLLVVILVTIIRCIPPKRDDYLEFEDEEYEEEDILEKEQAPIKKEFNSDDIMLSAGEQLDESDTAETVSKSSSDIMHQNIPTFV